MENGLFTVQMYAENVITIRDYIGLPRTNDTLNMKHYQYFLRI